MSIKAEVIDRSVGLQEGVVAFIRAFGLHQGDRSACGQPVSVSEAHALMELAGRPGLRQRDLVARLRLDKSTVSRLVRHLEGRGWVRHDLDPSDARAVRLHLTASGRRAAGRLAGARAEKFRRVMDAISPAEQDEVVRALRILVDAAYAAR